MTVVNTEFLNYRPKRVLEWREDPDGRVVLLRPKFGSSSWAEKFTNWLGAKHYRIRLDDIGTAVWKSLDGETPLSDVVESLREQFGKRIEPAETRLSKFVQQMIEARLIEL